jgi:hypothetical protein
VKRFGHGVSRGMGLRRPLIVLLCGALFAAPTMGAEGCQEKSEKLKRDSRELEEDVQKYERERGCEPTPPYNCPEAP